MTITKLKELRDRVRGLTGADMETDFALQRLWNPIIDATLTTLIETME